MAHAIFNILAPDGFYADSAGITATPGKRVSENSVIALSQIGIGCEHLSQPLTADLMNEYDFIIGITSDHARVIRSMFPKFESKIFSLPADVTDPYGCNLSEYVRCRDIIYDGVKRIIGEICHEQ